jgi:hypothetical protein
LRALPIVRVSSAVIPVTLAFFSNRQDDIFLLEARSPHPSRRIL